MQSANLKIWLSSGWAGTFEDHKPDRDKISTQVQPTDAPGRKELSLKEKRMRALKIGAAAAGGGAILAVTGTPVSKL